MTDFSPAADAGGHGLLCPACKTGLLMSDRQGIEIDYCPKCRGVWLDRGELDKIIERSLPDAQPAPPQQRAPQQAQYETRYDQYGSPGGRHGGEHGRHTSKHGGYGRRESFLSRLFDD